MAGVVIIKGVIINGVDLSAHVQTVTFNPEPGPVSVFIPDPVEEALRELLAAAGIERSC